MLRLVPRRLPLIALPLLGAACSPDAATAPLAVVASAADPRAASRTTERQLERVEVSVVRWMPCARNGAGEDVLLQGTYLQALAITEDADGTMHVRLQGHAQNVTGRGLDTGAEYRATGHGRVHYFTGRAPAVFQIDEREVLHAQGSADDAVFVLQGRAVLEADGTVRIVRDRFDITCR